jgi:hypothetical protein
MPVHSFASTLFLIRAGRHAKKEARPIQYTHSPHYVAFTAMKSPGACRRAGSRRDYPFAAAREHKVRTMRLRVWYFAIVLWLPFHVQAAESPPTGVLVLAGGRVIDGFGGTPLENAVVVVRGNRIEAVGRADAVAIPGDARTIDVSGMTLLPGLWESHGHLMHIGEGDPEQFPANYAARAKEVMGAIARTTLLSGITTFRDTGGPLEAQQALRADIEAGRTLGPRLYLAGPILRQRQPDPRMPRNFKHYPDQPDLISTPAQARTAAQSLIKRGVDQIKVYGFWDVEILREITATAHAANVGVEADVRHIIAYRTAVEAGVDRLHHVFTADALSDYSDEDIRLLVRGERPTGTGPMANILRGPYIIPTRPSRCDRPMRAPRAIRSCSIIRVSRTTFRRMSTSICARRGARPPRSRGASARRSASKWPSRS